MAATRTRASVSDKEACLCCWARLSVGREPLATMRCTTFFSLAIVQSLEESYMVLIREDATRFAEASRR